MQPRAAARWAIAGATFLAGCETAKDVAITSFKVIDAPAAYVRRQIDAEEQPEAASSTTTTTTTTTVPSDVTTPGHPVYAGPAAQQMPPAGPPPQTRPRPTPAASPRATPKREIAETQPAKPSPSPSPSPRVAASPAASQIPYAKPVPGKPGYVFSPFDPNGGYVDVTGYAPGSKVKDPYSGKIFLVP